MAWHKKMKWSELNQVLPLKDLATKALFEGIVAELVICPSNPNSEISVHEKEHSCPPAEKKRKMDETVDASSSSSTSLTSSLYSSRRREHLVREIRTRLSEYLVSSYSYVRHQLVQQFLDTVTVTGWSHHSHDIIVSFLDCLMDETFTKCRFIEKFEQEKHPFALINPEKLFKVLASRSPLIHKLKLCFGLPRRSVPFKPMIGQMLAVFKNLTSLSLDWKTTDRSCLLFFEALGDSCPKLITLKLLGHLPFGIQQVLALMLGKKRELLPRDFLEEIGGEEELAEVQFTRESVTPICNSLKHFKHSNSDDCLNPVFCSSAASLAFILRHFPQLQTWIDSGQEFKVLGTSVQLLHKQQQLASSINLNQQATTKISEELGLIQWRLNVPFSGLLKLVEVSGFNICSRNRILAIIALCPDVEFIKFFGHMYLIMSSDDVVSLTEFQSILALHSNCLSKVTKMSMCDVPTDFRKSLLNHLGHQLTLLDFLWCSNIDPIAELLPCTQLDNLLIKNSSFIPRPSLHHCVTDADNAQFLRNLEKLTTSSTCLGDWSSLFECPRPLLTHLILSCSHIGIESKSPSFDWHNIPEMWPNLQYLAILNTLNLTLDKLKAILILLNKLKVAH